MTIIVKTVYSKCYFLIDQLNIHVIFFAWIKILLLYVLYILIKINENKKVNNKIRVSLIENKFIKKNIYYKYNR